MSDFVRKPLMQQLNKDNPITRIEKLESGDTVKTSAVINDISQLSSNLGEMAAGKINFYNPTTGQLVGYLTSIPDPAYPNYYMVALDSAGNVQFSVDPSTSGATTMGNGAVSITESGIVIANGTASYILKDTSGNTNKIYLNATTDNNLMISNQVVGGDIDQYIVLTDATGKYLTWHENESLANQTMLTIDAGSAGLRVAFGTDHYIDALDSSGTGSATVYFNERNKDIDFNVQGATNNNLLFIDASLDAIGIGKAATSDNLMDVNGSINLVTGNTYKINGTDVKAPLIFGGHGFGGTIPASTTYYLVPYISGLDTAARVTVVPVAGTIKNLYFRLATNQPASGSLVIEVFAGSAGTTATGVKITIAASGVAGTYSDTTHTYSHAAGDLVTIKIINNATGASGTIGSASFELDTALVN